MVNKQSLIFSILINILYLCNMLKLFRYIFTSVILICSITFADTKCHAQQIINEDSSYIPLSLKNRPEQILFRKGYTVSYNKEWKIPNWVAWHLTNEHTSGPHHRTGNAWHEDTDVPYPRATTSDYKGSGWSRGHMCPAGDNKWDGEAMYESFLLTNCCPQNANLNSGDWNQIEMTCRRWAEKYLHHMRPNSFQKGTRDNR